MYIYIYLYIYIFIDIYTYICILYIYKNWLEVTHNTQTAQILQKYDERNIYVVKKTDNVPSRLLPICQWCHGNS